MIVTSASPLGDSEASQEPEDANTELVKDLLAIVTSFSDRLYGARGGRKVRETVAKAIAEVKGNGEVEEDPR